MLKPISTYLPIIVTIFNLLVNVDVNVVPISLDKTYEELVLKAKYKLNIMSRSQTSNMENTSTQSMNTVWTNACLC